MLACSKYILFNLKLTRNSRRIQEADRAFPNSPPWAGTVAYTLNKELATKVTHIKWEKTRSLVLEPETLKREDRVTHKILECIRRFLIYVARTFKWSDAIPQWPAYDY